jgi:multidrug resistance efflux pump
MEIILLMIYAFFVWLIFFKFKLLPWNFISQVIVVTIPIVAIAALVLILNVVAPSSHDVRVVNQVVAVVPRVTGRVTEVPIEPNRPIKKGDVLFKIDPVPFQLEVDSLAAKLAADEAKLTADTARLAADQARVTSEESNAAGAGANVTDAEAESRVLALNLAEMTAKSAAVRARLELAKKRLEQHRELVSGGAGDRFALEQAEADVKQQEADLAAVVASEAQVKERLSAQVGGDVPGVAGAKARLATAKSQVEIARSQARVAAAQIAMSKAQIDATKAQLEEAKWKLDQCVYYAPANGTVVSLALRPGAVASIMVTQPVMTFVEDEQWVLAIYHQNEVRNVKPEQEAEVAFAMHPGRVIKCRVDSVMWATAQGQLPIGGNSTVGGIAPIPPHSLAVRLLIDEKDKDVFLASGAHGAGAIYTDTGEVIHIVRKIMVRIGAKLDWFVPKLH